MKKTSLLFIILFAIFGIARADYEGTCGANLTWVLNTTTNTLTINGTGAMTNFDSGAPWYPYKDLIVKVIINTGATTIGKSAFAYCENLTTVSFCNTLTHIGELSFYKCLKLSNVTIPNSVNSIDHEAFGFCEKITQVILGENITNIGSAVFWECTGLEKINWNAKSCEYNDASNNTFSSCTKLKTVIFGNKVTRIPDNVFYSCQNIQNVTFGSSLQYIGRRAFKDCSKIASITLPNSLIKIEISAFENCSNLSQISFGNSLTTIEDYAFSKCVKLSTVSLPNSIRVIGFRAFEECSQLTSLSLGNGLLTIDNAAFYNCTKLQSFTLPQSLKRLGIEAFKNCYKITEINFPSNLDTIGQMCFSNCSILETINWDVQDLKYNQSNLFPDCNKLKNVIIGDNVTIIPNSVFNNTNITSLIIGQSVTFIDNIAFANCVSLSSIISHCATPPTISFITFNGVNPNINVTVPCGSGDLYKADANWSYFTNIVEETNCSFFINVQSSDDNMGTVTGSGCYNDGETVIVTAIPNTGFIFENWTENSVIVSNDSVYSFVADKNKTIIAHFKQNIDVDENYKPSFIIYPNPTNAYIEIVSDLNCYIYITDIMGRVLSSQTTSTETTQVDLCDLPSGIYFVSLIHDNKKTTQKIIKL